MQGPRAAGAGQLALIYYSDGSTDVIKVTDVDVEHHDKRVLPTSLFSSDPWMHPHKCTDPCHSVTVCDMSCRDDDEWKKSHESCDRMVCCAQDDDAWDKSSDPPRFVAVCDLSCQDDDEWGHKLLGAPLDGKRVMAVRAAVNDRRVSLLETHFARTDVRTSTQP
jgi:hypothetical protein